MTSRRLQAGTGDYSSRVLETSDTCLTIPHMVNECRLPLFPPGIDVPASCQSNKKQPFPGPPDYTLLRWIFSWRSTFIASCSDFCRICACHSLPRIKCTRPSGRGSWKVAFGSTMLGVLGLLLAPRGSVFTGNNRTLTLVSLCFESSKIWGETMSARVQT